MSSKVLNVLYLAAFICSVVLSVINFSHGNMSVGFLGIALALFNLSCVHSSIKEGIWVNWKSLNRN